MLVGRYNRGASSQIQEAVISGTNERTVKELDPLHAQGAHRRPLHSADAGGFGDTGGLSGLSGIGELDGFGSLGGLGGLGGANGIDGHGRKGGGKRKSNTLSNILLVLGLLLILVAAVIAGVMIYGYLDAQNRYSQIENASGLNIVMTDGYVDPNLDLASLVVNWDALREINADIVAWVVIPGTRVNYPIVQGDDNDYYLRHLFDSSYSGSGTVFLDSDLTNDFKGRNNIIYGHNMLDGHMFSDVTLFANQDYFDEHTTVFLLSPAMNFELRPLATLKMSQNTPLRRFSFSTDADFRSYTNEMFGYAISSIGGLSDKNANLKKVFSFVTCDTVDFSIRIVLTCEEVRSAVPLSADQVTPADDPAQMVEKMNGQGEQTDTTGADGSDQLDGQDGQAASDQPGAQQEGQDGQPAAEQPQDGQAANDQPGAQQGEQTEATGTDGQQA